MEIKLTSCRHNDLEPWSSMVFLGKEGESREKFERIEYGNYKVLG